MKNLFQLLIICFLLFVGQRTFGESVTSKVHFSQMELKCDTITGGDGQVYNLLSYPDTENGYDNPGVPTLPVKYVTIPLPYTADDISLSVRNFNTESYAISKKIFPYQEPEPTSFEKTQKEFTPCDERIYKSVKPYPTEQARITEVSCVGHGDRLVVVAVYPITYCPAENRYDFSEDIELTLTYNHSSKRAEALTRNPRSIDIGIPFYEYCVITSQNLKDAFTRLVAWKREKGLNAGVICKEDIISNNYCLVGDTVSNINDDAGKIRQYLQYAYASGVTKYVLFGGNAGVLPIRYGTGDNNTWTSWRNVTNDYKIPSDFYFSELNSNWNKDRNDVFYGEPSDNLDYGAELFVGRLLCTNSEEIHNYTDKLLRYEMNPGNGDFSYLKKALYTQDDQMQKWHEQESIAEQLHNIFPIDTIFSEAPSYDAPDPTYPYGNDVIEEMNERYGFVSWGGHGHPNAISVKSDSCATDPVYGITSVQGNIPYITQESANGLDNLTNKEYPMFAYSIACTITPFDVFNQYTEFPNIGQSFTLGKDYGGPVLVGNTRYGWTGLYTPSASLQKKFNEGMMIEPMVGYAQNYAKLNYHTSFYDHFLRHSSNIIGCPNIRIWTDIPQLFSATLSYNYNNYVISANNSITDAEIGVRDITQTNEVIDNISFNPSQGSTTLTNVENSLITLTGKNCLPQIMPLTIQNTALHGTHYAIVKDVTCGSDVRNGTQGDVTFEQDSDFTFETKGTFTLTKDVEIKLGAQLKVTPSEINY